jgi:hypothetical protein
MYQARGREEFKHLTLLSLTRVWQIKKALLLSGLELIKKTIIQVEFTK